jgi:hypothetical protein
VAAATEFETVYSGQLWGILEWSQLDALWAWVRARPEGWYVYAVGEAPPAEVVAPEALVRFTEELNGLLRTDHRETYCGIVYVDAREAPRLIKVYDPNNLGVVCGSSAVPPLPGWVISRMPPVDLKALRPQTNARRRWWRRLFPV